MLLWLASTLGASRRMSTAANTAANISWTHGRAATDTGVSKAAMEKLSYCFLP